MNPPVTSVALSLAAPGLVVEPSERSWMPATAFGWALGYLSTRMRGAHGMYVTTEAVESFVEEHYGDQIARSLAAKLTRFTEMKSLGSSSTFPRNITTI